MTDIFFLILIESRSLFLSVFRRVSILIWHPFNQQVSSLQYMYIADWKSIHDIWILQNFYL